LIDLDVPDAMLKKLFATNAPKDPEAFGRYVSQMMKKTSVLIANFHGGDATRDSRFEALVNRVCGVIERVFNMRRGDRMAQQLYLDLKIHVLPTDREKYPSEFCIRMHGAIDKHLTTILKNAPSQMIYLDVGAACQRLESRVSDIRCDMDIPSSSKSHDNACQHNVLIPTLDLFQRHAYFEVLANVRSAVGNHLPAEITRTIFEGILTDYRIPKDPRVVVPARHAFGATRRINDLDKCLLPCKHDVRRGKRESGTSKANQCGHLYAYVMGNKYTANLPHIPDHIVTSWDLRKAEWTAAKAQEQTSSGPDQDMESDGDAEWEDDPADVNPAGGQEPDSYQMWHSMFGGVRFKKPAEPNEMSNIYEPP
jgi:hypothetical protein